MERPGVEQPKGGSRKLRAKRKKMPKHALEMRAFRYPLELTTAEAEILFQLLDRCWEVRNLLAVEREENRSGNRNLCAKGLPVHFLNRDDQNSRVSELQKAEPRYQGIHSQVLQNIVHRIDGGTKGWLESLGQPGKRKVNPPGPIERKAYSSFTFPQCGPSIGIWGGRAHLGRLGSFKLIQHRKYRGTPKTITIRFDSGRWWAILICALQAKTIYRDPVEVEHLEDTGADPGLKELLVLADGTAFDPPRAFKHAFGKIRLAQRVLSRKFRVREASYEAERARREAAGLLVQPPIRLIPYSNRLRAQIKKVAMLHTDAVRVREYHHRKLASRLDDSYRKVAVEEHGVAFMFANRKQAKSAADRAIAAMKHFLVSKMGDRVRLMPNRRPGIGGNSQTCLCGAPVPKLLENRKHLCPVCGLAGKRDVVSANIVMQMAFGWNLLQQVHQATETAVAGQAIVRRGGAKGRGQSLSAESKGPSVPHTGQGAGLSASEVPLNRQPQSSLKTEKTRGGEPTREAKSSRISGSPLLLDEAKGLVGGGDVADGKLCPPWQ